MRSLIVMVMVALGATAAHAGEPARVTLIVVGNDAARIEGAMAHADLPVEVVVGHLPGAAPPPHDLSPRLAAARQAYVNGDFAACLDGLGGDALLVELLAAGRPGLAARVAFWQIACRVGSGALPAAAALARQFAAWGLEPPADVAAATPEVELLLSNAIRAAQTGPRVRLTVTAPPLRAPVALDGKPAVCTTPCVLAVIPGDHVVTLDAEAYLPVTRRVPVSDGGAELTLDVSPASPEVAAAQWSVRYRGSPLVSSEASTRLLAMAIAARRLVLVNAEGTRDLRLRGTLASDGLVRAQTERTATPAALDGEARRLLRDLLVSGKVLEPSRPVWKRAAFWVPLTLAVTAAVVSASVAASLRPDVHTRVGF